MSKCKPQVDNMLESVPLWQLALDYLFLHFMAQEFMVDVTTN